jgi:head-tail adaptor
MKGIGGNIKAMIQVCTSAKNDIGEHVQTWTDAQQIKGWLDLSSGESRYTTYHAKIQESTHVFIAEYVPLDSRITAEASRMVINGKRYDVLLIDNPMEIGTGSQLEIYLKFTGGQ